MCSSHAYHAHEEEACKCGVHLSRFLEPRLLLLLRERESYGYELIDGVNELPFSDSLVDPGAVYRTLRQMESEGLVSSEWNTKESGPARRVYRITGDGEDRLYEWVTNLKRRKEAIMKFLKRYGRR